MIRGHCRVNVDGYDLENWPHVFCAVPRNGECVESRSGKVLKVCRITYLVEDDWQELERPVIAVELTKVI